MAKGNNLKTKAIVVLLGMLATAILGSGSWIVVRVNDHETRLSVVEVVIDRIDKNVEKLLEK